MYNPTSIKTHRQAQHFLTTPLGSIAYVDEGEGKPLLLIHGVPTSSWLYRNMINEFVKKGFRVVAPDLLGFGNSDKPDGYEIYGFENQADLIIHLMDHLKIDKWTHICHGVGGIWTWELIKKAPDRIENLVLLNTIAAWNGYHPPMIFKTGLIAEQYTNSYKETISSKMMIKTTFNNGMVDYNLTKKEIKGYYKPMLEGGNKVLYHFLVVYQM